jgi:LCP family protein required for cell wall assembly
VLATYALGLLPFYFLTPVRDALPRLLNPPPVAAPVQSGVPLASPTPSKAEAQKKAGADAVSVPAPTAESAQNAVAVPNDVASDSRYAFLLLGYGGGGHDGAYLSDSMIVVVVDPDRKTLALVSIPRDSWIPMTFDGKTAVYNKINTAYAFAQDPSLYPDRLARYEGDRGAGVFAADTVSRLVGVPVRYYMGIDFAGFRQMINTVGGIDVDVPASFAARYPANDDPSIDASWMTVRFTKGPEHMTGERAIEFARAREPVENFDEGSDFARSRRQRLIIEAFKDRLLQPGGLIHLPELIGIGSSHIDTNYTIPDGAGLSKLALDWKNVHIYQTAITNQNFLEDATGPDCTYTIVPRSSTHSWAQIRGFMRKMWDNPAVGATISQVHIVVENDTGQAGAATRASTVLSALGYNVDPPVSGTVRTTSRVIDPSGRQVARALLPSFAQDLGLKNLESFDDTVDPTAPLLLQLGSNDLNAIPAVVADDRTAPSSTVGIVKFGEWEQYCGPAVQPPVVVPPPIDPKRRTPTPSRVVTNPTTGPEGAGRASPTSSHSPATPVPGLARTPTSASR